MENQIRNFYIAMARLPNALQTIGKKQPYYVDSHSAIYYTPQKKSATISISSAYRFIIKAGINVKNNNTQ